MQPTIWNIAKNIYAPLKKCEECGGDVKKQISAPAFRLKGSGWYETDYKTGNKKNLSSSDDSSGTKKDTGNDKVSKNSKEDKQANSWEQIIVAK